jgi:hypothetical protein
MRQGYLDDFRNVKVALTGSPTPLPPFAQGRVVAVPGVDHRRVRVDVEHPTGDIGRQLREIASLPGFSDAAGELVWSLEMSHPRLPCQPSYGSS